MATAPKRSRWAARSTSTRPSTSREGLRGSAIAKPPSGRAGRPVRRQHLHGDRRRRRQGPKTHPATAPATIRRPRSSSWAATPPGPPTKWPPCRASPRSLPISGNFPSGSPAAGWPTSRRAYRRFAGASSGLRQGAGRLPHEVQLLHHPQVRPVLAEPPGRMTCWRKIGDWSITITAKSCSSGSIWAITAWRAARRADSGSACRRIAELPGEFRFRISSVESTEMTPELIRVVADVPGELPALAHSYAKRRRTRCCNGCAAAPAAGFRGASAGRSPPRWTSRL